MKGDKGKKEQIEDYSEFICKGNIAKRYMKMKKVCNLHYGELFLVKSKITGEIYSCRQIKRSKIADIDKFFRETTSLLKLTHPNLPKTIDVYDSPKFVYVIQEYIKGTPLFNLIINHISNGEKFSEKDAVYFYSQLMAAIHALHAVGIPHRDIKPENILVVENPDIEIENKLLIKLVDAATSKIFGELKNTLSSLGKKTSETKSFNPMVKFYDPYYTPMELLQGNYDEKSDVWSATVILYQMLTGLVPFKGEDPNEILKSISRKRVTLKGVSLSDDAKDFFKKIFVEYAQRLTSQQVLDYEYVKNYSKAPDTNLGSFDLEKFKTFSKSHIFKKDIINIMIDFIKPEEIIALSEIFDSIKGEDGYITINQLKENILKDLDDSTESKKQLKNYFVLLDVNGDGKIEFNEFLRVALEQTQFFNEATIRKVFNMIDTDGNGYLSREELSDASFATKMTPERINEIFTKFDVNNDGRINYEEFLTFLEAYDVRKEEEEEKKEEEKKEDEKKKK